MSELTSQEKIETEEFVAKYLARKDAESFDELTNRHARLLAAAKEAFKFSLRAAIAAAEESQP